MTEAGRSTRTGRAGRPPKLDDEGRPTRDRLLSAARRAFIDHGYEGATLSQIADAADIATPSIYNHFASKTELFFEASVWSLRRLGMSAGEVPDDLPTGLQQWLSDGNRDRRRLVVELHHAALRHPEVGEMLAAWQQRVVREWTNDGQLNSGETKLALLVLLGLAQVDAVAGLDADPEEFEAALASLAGWLVEREPSAGQAKRLVT